MTRPTLPERIVAIHDAFAAVPHAFGGALALAYYADPRATRDIDCNVFVPSTDAAVVLDPLRGLGVESNGAAEAILRDGQVRVMWDDVPIDLFFAYDPFHDAAHGATLLVPFADTTIPVLSATHLAVCKVVFDRPKDWVDIDAMLDAGTAIDLAELMRWAGRICGDEDPRYRRAGALFNIRRAD